MKMNLSLRMAIAVVAALVGEGPATRPEGSDNRVIRHTVMIDGV